MNLLAQSRIEFLARMVVRLVAPLSFVVLVVATSYLSSEQVAGELVTLLSIVMVCSTIGRLGFDQLILENRVEWQSKQRVLVSSCLHLGVLFSGVVASLFVGAVQWIPWLQGFKMFVGPSIIVSCMAAAISQLASTFAQSQHRTVLSVMLFPTMAYQPVEYCRFLTD